MFLISSVLKFDGIVSCFKEFIIAIAIIDSLREHTKHVRYSFKDTLLYNFKITTIISVNDKIDQCYNKGTIVY